MMRHALRRILWIVPTLIAITALAFGALSSMPATAPEFAEDLPLFVNLEPRDVRTRTLELVEHVAAAGPEATRSAERLARLGGAALPYVLPRLDELGPGQRRRVALALAPVAQRMGVGSSAEFTRAESAVVFWSRFWQDRAMDFRPLVVRRLVRRMAQDSTALRHADVLALDTFALSELIAAMPPVRSPRDVERVRRLTSLASHLTDNPWQVAPNASVADARQTVERWQRWWLRHRWQYMSFDGPRRVAAMLLETRYGRWAADAATSRLGVTAEGYRVLDVLKARAPITLWLTSAALLGGYVVGIAVGLAGALRALRTADLVASAVAVCLLAVPAASWAAWAASSGRGAGLAAATLVMVSVSSALVSRHQRASARAALDQDYTRTAIALGCPPWRLLWRSFRPASAAVVALLAVDLPALASTAFVVEHAFALPGLGPITVEAVRTRDVSWLMAMTVLTATSVALLQVFSDALLAALDPRVHSALERQRGGAE
jgi:peptide/nickel transport system permease protein